MDCLFFMWYFLFHFVVFILLDCLSFWFFVFYLLVEKKVQQNVMKLNEYTGGEDMQGVGGGKVYDQNAFEHSKKCTHVK